MASSDKHKLRKFVDAYEKQYGLFSTHICGIPWILHRWILEQQYGKRFVFWSIRAMDDAAIHRTA